MASQSHSIDELYWPGADGISYSIGEAAALVAASPSALRRFEHQGLVIPFRKPGGHRHYSGADLARLRRIVYLHTVEGLNAAAIRRELAVLQPGGSSESQRSDLGGRIRWWRRHRGWTIAELARRTGLSTSMLSAAERSQVRLSHASLQRVARALDAARELLGPMPPALVLVVRFRDRKQHEIGYRQVVEELLHRDAPVRARTLQVGPGAERTERVTADQFLVLQRGVLDVILDGEPVRIAAGDSLFIRQGSELHWRNSAGVTAVTALWVELGSATRDGTWDAGSTRHAVGSASGASLEGGRPEEATAEVHGLER